MDAGLFSALAALSGSIIGGVTPLAVWLSHNVWAQPQQAAATKMRRQDLYNAFIEEASRFYGDALANDKGEIGTILAGLHAMVSRMCVLSGPQVVDSADKVIRLIIDTYFAPNEPLRELREAIKTTNVDPLREFSDACRQDLRAGVLHKRR